MESTANRYPKELHHYAVVVREHDAPITQISRDFKIFDASQRNLLMKVDVEVCGPGPTQKDAAEMRELKSRNRIL
jgi:transposase